MLFVLGAGADINQIQWFRIWHSLPILGYHSPPTTPMEALTDIFITDGVFSVFVVDNGLSYIGASLTYLNFCVGMSPRSFPPGPFSDQPISSGVTVTFCFVPVQTYLFTRDRLKHGRQRPEARFLTSLVAVWLFPISLFWFAFTCYGKKQVSFLQTARPDGALPAADITCLTVLLTLFQQETHHFGPPLSPEPSLDSVRLPLPPAEIDN